jgi:hypothetical protein
MAPPQVIISQPQPTQQQDNSLLSSFITSKLLNESMNLNRSNMTNIEQPTTREQPSYFNARESIIPKMPDTPLKQEMKEEIKPPVENGPPPPPAPPKPMEVLGAADKISSAFQSKLYSDQLRKYQAVNNALGPMLKQSTAREKYIKARDRYYDKKESNKLKTLEAQADYVEKVLKKVDETQSAKKENKKQSTTDFLNMSFTPPKKDIVEMMTPSKERTSTAITPYKGQQSTLEFLMGGTPQKTKPTQEDIKKARLTELKKKEKINAKELFELNDLKSHFTTQPNPNKDIARSIIGESIKRKAASEKVKNIKEKPIKTIEAIYRGNKIRNKLANDQDFQNKIDMKIKKYGDAASEYKTRGADVQDINKEFSDVMKTMRTGLQKYKTTLGTQPKKRGPKPKNLYAGLKQTEI